MDDEVAIKSQQESMITSGIKEETISQPNIEQVDSQSPKGETSGGVKSNSMLAQSQTNQTANQELRASVNSSSGAYENMTNHIGQRVRAEEFQVTADKRLNDLFADQKKVIPYVFGATEIDLFSIETKARKTIHNLIRPFQEQVSKEREVRAEYEIKNDKLLKRMQQLEDTFQITNNKPKYISDIESSIAEIRSKEMYDFQQLNGKLDQTQERQDMIDTNISELKASNRIMERTFDLREQEMKAVLVKNLEIKNDLIRQTESIYQRIEDVRDEFEQHLNANEKVINQFCEKIQKFTIKCDQNSIDIRELKTITANQIRQLHQFNSQKIDTVDVVNMKSDVNQSLETFRLSTLDTMEQLLATDNYLEKYIPFKIQMMISESLESFFDELVNIVYESQHKIKKCKELIEENKQSILTNKNKLDAMEEGKLKGILGSSGGGASLAGNRAKKGKKTHEDDFQMCDSSRRTTTFRDVYKDYEHGIFKRLHKTVMADKGLPNLKKRGFYMPGCRELLTNDEVVQKRSDYISQQIEPPDESVQDMINKSARDQSIEQEQQPPTSEMLNTANIPAIDLTIELKETPQESPKGGAEAAGAPFTAKEKPSKLENYKPILSESPKIRKQGDITPKKQKQVKILDEGAGREGGGSKESSKQDAPINEDVAQIKDYHELKKVGSPMSEEQRAESDLKSGSAFKQVGLDDLDWKANEKIDKAYINSFLMMENWGLMKSDFKMLRKEVFEDLEKKMEPIKYEFREVLQKQLGFIQETTIKHLKDMSDNKEMIKDQEMKIQSISQNQNALSSRTHRHSYSQRRESQRRRVLSIHSKAVVMNDLSRENPSIEQKVPHSNLNIEDLLSYTDHKKEQAKNMGKDSAPTEIIAITNEGHSQPQSKGMKGWLTEGLKLQNILNNQLYGMCIQNQSQCAHLLNTMTYINSKVPEEHDQLITQGAVTNLSQPTSENLQGGAATALCQRLITDQDQKAHRGVTTQMKSYVSIQGQVQPYPDDTSNTMTQNLPTKQSGQNQFSVDETFKDSNLQNSQQIQTANITGTDKASGTMQNTREVQNSSKEEEIQQSHKGTRITPQLENLNNLNNLQLTLSNQSRNTMEIQSNTQGTAKLTQATGGISQQSPSAICPLSPMGPINMANEITVTNAVRNFKIDENHKDTLPQTFVPTPNSNTQSFASPQVLEGAGGSGTFVMQNVNPIQQYINLVPPQLSPQNGINHNIDCLQVLNLLDRIVEQCEVLKKNDIDYMGPAGSDTDGSQVRSNIFTNKKIMSSKQKKPRGDQLNRTQGHSSSLFAQGIGTQTSQRQTILKNNNSIIKGSSTLKPDQRTTIASRQILSPTNADTLKDQNSLRNNQNAHLNNFMTLTSDRRNSAKGKGTMKPTDSQLLSSSFTPKSSLNQHGRHARLQSGHIGANYMASRQIPNILSPGGYIRDQMNLMNNTLPHNISNIRRENNKTLQNTIVSNDFKSFDPSTIMASHLGQSSGEDNRQQNVKLGKNFISNSQPYNPGRILTPQNYQNNVM